jgi:hypothetical protein
MTLKKMKNGRRPQKKMEDDLNFKAVLLKLFNNKKNSKTNGFDTIEIDLVYAIVIIRLERNLLFLLVLSFVN